MSAPEPGDDFPVVRVAVFAPLRKLFDYLPLQPDAMPEPGCRVRVPFGRGSRIGVVVERGVGSGLPYSKLKALRAVLDEAPVLSAADLVLLQWAAEYYRYPLGEVIAAALPGKLRKGEAAGVEGRVVWTLTDQAPLQAPARAVRQQAVLDRLREAGGAGGRVLFEGAEGNWTTVLNDLERKGWLTRRVEPCLPVNETLSGPVPVLNEDQSKAVTCVWEHIQDRRGFGVFLLDGVTGSGKTEVYLQWTERVVREGGQVLVLAPEIGLTPQLVRRFRGRIAAPVAVLHSGLGDRERLCAWSSARQAEAVVVIGTRSAVFCPMPRLGLVIVDEEHDASLKQQEGFRYSARDLAVVRARMQAVPVVLGTATPSLESLHNVASGRFRRLCLPERAGGAGKPDTQVLDVRGLPMRDGISPPLEAEIRRHLEAGSQVLLFLNRRGFAPVLTCHACGWVAECHRCDARMVVHQRERRLRCHHCAAERPLEDHCPACGSPELVRTGLGTERVEAGLKARFPNVPRVRLDRDATRCKGALEAGLERARSGEVKLILGTQMLAKGHHFPEVTLAAVLDADAGLYGVDFRAAERMGQLLVQVAGRSGRADRNGRVMIQTRHPDHPALATLLQSGYGAFCRLLLQERKAAGLPPYQAMSLLRAEARTQARVWRFLEAARAALPGMEAGAPALGGEVLGPVEAPMARRQDRFRGQLMLLTPDKRCMQRLLADWVDRLDTMETHGGLRWSLDVDAADTY